MNEFMLNVGIWTRDLWLMRWVWHRCDTNVWLCNTSQNLAFTNLSPTSQRRLFQDFSEDYIVISGTYKAVKCTLKDVTRPFDNTTEESWLFFEESTPRALCRTFRKPNPLGFVMLKKKWIYTLIHTVYHATLMCLSAYLSLLLQKIWIILGSWKLQKRNWKSLVECGFLRRTKYFQSAMDFLPVDHALLFIALKTTWKVDQCKTAILILKTITDNFQFRSISWSF